MSAPAFIGGCVLSGALINVGVAWLCVWASHPATAPGAAAPGTWPSGTPRAWGTMAACSYVDARFGASTGVFFDSSGESIRACGSNGSSVDYDGTRRQVETVSAGWPLRAMESLRMYEYHEHWEYGSGFDKRGEWKNHSSAETRGGCINAGTRESGWCAQESSDEGVAGLTYPLTVRPAGFAGNTLFWSGAVGVAVGFVRYGSIPRTLGGSGGRRVPAIKTGARIE